MKNKVIDNDSRNAHPFRLCSRCEEKKPPEGGVAMGPGKWVCAACWLYRMRGGK